MKQYHTQIDIAAPASTVWKYLTDFASYPDWNPIVGKLDGEMIVGKAISTYIVPLGKTYQPVLLAWEPTKELVWRGTQGTGWLMAGEHYYRLEPLSPTRTRLLHGEQFTGLMSNFIGKDLLAKMENAFTEHNRILKQRVEHEN